MLAVEKFILDYLVAFTEQFGERERFCASFYEKYFTENLIIKYRQHATAHGGLRKNLARYQQAKNMVKSTSIVEFSPVILSVDAQGESATIITSEQYPWTSEYERRRYHLLNTTVGWKIDRKGTVCFSCIGTGMDTISKGRICSRCEGLGWQYYGASK